jgi:hypothetical protein
MEKVILVVEENHGVILVATNEDAAKRALLEADWVDNYSSIYVEDRVNEFNNHFFSLEEIYGENWEEEYMKFDESQMENLGFYFRKTALYK